MRFSGSKRRAVTACNRTSAMSLCNSLMTPKPMETKSTAFRSFKTPIAMSQRLRFGWECVVKAPLLVNRAFKAMIHPEPGEAVHTVGA
jgi:hypothetical protein